MYNLTDISKADNPTVSSGYGDRIHPLTLKKTFHNGIDIPMKIGTEITAIEDGKVVLVNKHKQGGNQLRVQHDENKTGEAFIAGYAHLHKVYVKVGQLVKKGDIIALSGNTGAGTGPHLHFTTRGLDQEVFNPLTVFEK